MLPLLLQLAKASCCRFCCCWFYPSHCCWGTCCPFFCGWCRRYAAHFTAVGVRAVLYNTAKVDDALFNAVDMDVVLPIYCGYGIYCPFLLQLFWTSPSSMAARSSWLLDLERNSRPSWGPRSSRRPPLSWRRSGRRRYIRRNSSRCEGRGPQCTTPRGRASIGPPRPSLSSEPFDWPT